MRTCPRKDKIGPMTSIRSGFGAAVRLIAALGPLACSAAAQVHYHADGSPWNQRAEAGPDAEVPGWYYNLGLSGLRVELVESAPTHLLVRHVLRGSPAEGLLAPGDHVVGAGGRRFETPHQNGYGMEVFGARGPVSDFAEALEACQAPAGDGRLLLTVERGERSERPMEVELTIGKGYGSYAPSFPAGCPKSERIRRELLESLLAAQGEDGSFGDPVVNTFAPLALLASGEARHLAAVERNARFHAASTSARDEDDLIHWRYMAAAIVLGEYFLASGADWVPPELEQIRDFLLSSQYLRLEQVNPEVKNSHPDSYPSDARQQHGGWGHNPGFEGYGPIAMLTAQGLLALSLIERCGVPVERARLEAARDFLERGAGPNGYVWYADQVAAEADWADMGRTGATAIALQLYRAPDAAIRERVRTRLRQHVLLIGEHPQSFPDTHGSPLMGMGYGGVAAHLSESSFRSLMDANRWWFSLAQCPDGSFCYQPNRDNAGYGSDSRLCASAVTAFLFSLPRRSLAITGRALPAVLDGAAAPGETAPGDGSSDERSSADEPPAERGGSSRSQAFEGAANRTGGAERRPAAGLPG
jgi:hypothetical protein